MTMPPPPPQAPYGPGYGYSTPATTPTPPGGAGPYGTPGTPGYGPPAPAPAQPPRPKGNLLRNTVWAFAGAALATGGWIGALTLVPDLVSSSSSARGTGSYHVADNLCTAAEPKELLRTNTPSDLSKPDHTVDRHPNLDSMYCSWPFKTESGYSHAFMRVDLHKKVNPGPEFTAARDTDQARGAEIRAVPDLGEEAYFRYKDEVDRTGSSTWHSIRAAVVVRDGGVTYELDWSASFSEGKATPPSKDDLRQTLLTDSRAALRALQQ